MGRRPVQRAMPRRLTLPCPLPHSAPTAVTYFAANGTAVDKVRICALCKVDLEQGLMWSAWVRPGSRGPLLVAAGGRHGGHGRRAHERCMGAPRLLLCHRSS